MTEDPWKQAWRTAGAKQAANAPRQAALRDAVAAVRAQDLVTDADVRAALTAELHRRDEAVDDTQLDLMVRMTRTSPAGATLVAGREVFDRVRDAVGHAAR